MTAADQPTTPMMSGPGHASFCGNEAPHKMHRHPEPDSYEGCSGRDAPIAPAPQPAADTEGLRRAAASDRTDEETAALLYAAADTIDSLRAADTETEVQWGVRALLDAASDAERIIANGDVAEIAAAPPGAVGRQTAVDARDAIYEDPAAWLRARAKTLMEEA